MGRENLYNLIKSIHLWEWQKQLKEEAEKVGLDFQLLLILQLWILEDLGVDFYKIASLNL